MTEGLEHRECGRCEIDKYYTAFPRQYTSGWLDINGDFRYTYCSACYPLHMAKHNPRSNAISWEMERRMFQDEMCYEIYPKPCPPEVKALRLRLRAEIAKEYDADNGVALEKVRRKNTRTRMVVPKPKMRLIPAREAPDEGPTSKALRNNLIYEKGACEFTGANPRFCDEAHVLARFISRRTGNTDQIADEDNVIFVIVQINRAMQCGYYLDLDGFLRAPPGEEYCPILKTLGVHKKQIEMTDGRRHYARMAMIELGIIQPTLELVVDNGAA